ncbi:fructosamine kinase family protein [Salegentibacter sediminis]|uniref:fructosamine kinase family protein n=1 Tax=Salegentibacter sediminis TaxID=1930251 RepID=UPI0009C18400|nr:fructosamine kinase family protein [Salegentibacter sediminis]
MSVAKLLDQIAEQHNLRIKTYSPLSGGDINEVFLLTSEEDGKLVVKLNDTHKFPGMFEAEKLGLEQLRQPGVIDIPKVIAVGSLGNTAYLLLEYKKSRPKAPDFAERFGQQLAALHKTTSKEFGFPEDNYIGSLPQYNQASKSAADFYIGQRLEPQLSMAKDRGYSLHLTGDFFRNISEIIPKEPPALIHGDLWNGNYLVNEKGLPCLIDPATAYAPREMDLAMMKLFGGFPEEIFSAYNARFPLVPGLGERVPLWQLYYLLVHLNLFGKSYLASVNNIIKKYS